MRHRDQRQNKYDSQSHWLTLVFYCRLLSPRSVERRIVSREPAVVLDDIRVEYSGPNNSDQAIKLRFRRVLDLRRVDDDDEKTVQAGFQGTGGY